MLSLTPSLDLTLDPTPPKNLGPETNCPQHQPVGLPRVRRASSSPAVTGERVRQSLVLLPAQQQQQARSTSRAQDNLGEGVGQPLDDAADRDASRQGGDGEGNNTSISAPLGRTARGGRDPHDFECSICSDIVYMPVVGPCGHDFCLSCLRSWAAASAKPSGKFHCPICRTELPHNLGVCHRLKSVMEFCFPEQLERRRQELDMKENKLQGSHKGLLCSQLSLVRAPNPVTFEAAIQEQQQQQRRQQQQQYELQQLSLGLNSMLTPDMSAQMFASLPADISQTNAGSWGGGLRQQAVFPAHEPDTTFAEVHRNLPPRPGSAGQVFPWQRRPGNDNSQSQPSLMLLHDQAGGMMLHEQVQGAGMMLHEQVQGASQASREPAQRPATAPVGVPPASVGRGAVQLQQGGAAAEADASPLTSPPAATPDASFPGATGRPSGSENRHVSWLGSHHARAYSEELMHSRLWNGASFPTHPEPPAPTNGSSSTALPGGSPLHTLSPPSHHKHSNSGSSFLSGAAEGKLPSRTHSRVPSRGRRCSHEMAPVLQAEGVVLSSALRLGLSSLRTPSEYASQGSASQSHRGSDGGGSQMCTYNSLVSDGNQGGAQCFGGS